MDEADLGTLPRHDDRWTLRFTRRLAHSREKIWRIPARRYGAP